MFKHSIRVVLISIAFACAAPAQNSYSPITAAERLRWLAQKNFGAAGVLEDVVVAAEATRENSPREYGTHWSGAGKRFGMITANYGVNTAMEAGLGSLWGEDPRYTPVAGMPFANRLGHVVKMTFVAYDRAGNTIPAYARLLAIPGGSFAANSWMPDSQATVREAAFRTGLGFLGRMGENAWKEFRPHR